jgi:hypothetical protein
MLWCRRCSSPVAENSANMDLYSGMANSDVQKLKRSEIGDRIEDGKWIFANRQKMRSLSRIPLLPEAQEILFRDACRQIRCFRFSENKKRTLT